MRQPGRLLKGGIASRSAWTARADASTTSLSSGRGVVSNTRRSTSMLMRLSPKPGRYWCLAGLLQHRAPAPEPGLSHAAADLPGRPMDMWTIGVADRLCSPASRASSESREMLAFGHIPTGTTNHGFDLDEVNSRQERPAVPPAIGAGIETDGATP
jgi:hypothetical protein